MRGLWYFFGIVVAAGIFGGIAGLGIGYVGGVLWEQLHRHRRGEKLKAKALAEDSSEVITAPTVSDGLNTPHLQLVSLDSPEVPDLAGRTLTSLRFHTGGIQLELSGMRIDVRGSPLIVSGLQRIRFPDPGSRDALCSLIGDRIESVRAPSAERIEIRFASGSELVMARSTMAVA